MFRPLFKITSATALLLLSMGSFLSTRALASSSSQCSVIDLRDARPELGNYFHHPQNQGGQNWCYAYGAADLIAFATGKEVSATALALNYEYYYTHPATPGSSVGRAEQVLDMAMSHKACAISALPSTPGHSSQDYLHQKNKVPSFVSLVNCVNRIRTGDTPLDQMMSSYGSREKVCRLTARDLFPRLSVRYLFQSLSQSSASQPYEWMKAARDMSCRNSEIDIPHLNYQILGREYDLISELDAILESGRPALADYSLAPIMKKPVTQLHSSLILGRTCCNNQCRYLVRNQFGNDCSLYTPEIQSACDKDEGTFWISREELAPLLQYLIYIE